MLSNGLLMQIQVCLFSGDIQEINFDKYLVGKLSEHVSDGRYFSLSLSLTLHPETIYIQKMMSYFICSNYYQKSFGLYIQ